MGGRFGSGVANLVAAIIADPAWLPHRVLETEGVLEFVHLQRDDLRGRSFLDKGSVSEDIPRAEVPISAIKPQPVESESCDFIFHSAYCCSTLMSRALDIEGIASVLKEPQALADLAKMMPSSGWPEVQKRALEIVLDLMRRPRQPGEKTLIKPATIVNPLIDHMMEVQPRSRALLMYAPLPDYLIAVARGRQWSWARKHAPFQSDHSEFESPQTKDLRLLTDFQMAAFLWLQNQAQFARLGRELPTGRIATLRSDVFLNQPAKVLAAAAAFFELELGEEEAAAITAGPIFRSHSKRPGEVFNESVRKHEDVLLNLAYGPEIDRALGWAKDVASEASVPMDLPAPLVE